MHSNTAEDNYNADPSLFIVPEEIQQDPYALDLYERALKEGKEKERSIRINVVGNFGQGKTSLVRRILGQKVADVTSTDGIDVIHYKCHVTEDGTFSFKTADDNSTCDLVDRLVSVALASEHKSASSILQSKNKEDEANENKVQNTPNTINSENSELLLTKQNKGENTDQECKGPEQDNSTSLSTTLLSGNKDGGNKAHKKTILSAKEKETFAKEITKRKLQRKSKAKYTIFDIWDFGGQHVFYATHSLFHSKNAIYLLVFDLSIDLKSVIVDTDFPEDSDNKDMEYFMRFWMNSIHSFVGSKDGLMPKVVLVGTHKDKIKGNTTAREEQIEQYFNSIRTLFDGTKLLKHIHSEDFAVDNTIRNDENVSALQETIVKLGKAQSKAVEVPAKWIQLEQALTESKHLKIMSFENVLRIDKQMEVPIEEPEQIKLFLRYHHNKGTYIYFDEEPLSEYVVLQPQYLIDAFKCIITSERFCTKDADIRPLWKMLHMDGRLEKTLIDYQWGKDADKMFLKRRKILIMFLIKHHIISEVTSLDDTSQQILQLGWFIVPSMLKAYIPHMEIQRFLDGRKQTTVRFVMQLENSAIVPTVFHRLMAALIGRWPIAELGKTTLFSRDKCIILLDRNHAGIAEMRHDTLELTVVSLCPYSNVSPTQADIFRRFSESLVIHEFSKLERKHDDLTKPYETFYRCNHEAHGWQGSMKIVNMETLKKTNSISCPDLEGHVLDVRKADIEWFQNHLAVPTVSNPELNDKILSKISRSIGNNWQSLGLDLGVTKVQIDQISEDNPYSTAMRIYYMLRCWCRQNPESANINVLVQKMQECSDVNFHWDTIRNIVDEMK